MKSAFLRYSLLAVIIIIVTSCIIKSPPPPRNGQTVLHGKPGVRKTIVKDHYRQSFIQIDYRVDSGRIVFFFDTKDFYPSIQIDFNQNEALDENIDRSYGVYGDDTLYICAQYLLDVHSSTLCGDAPSYAALSVNGSNYEFNIPLNEVKFNSSSDVLCQFRLYSEKTGMRYYPKGAEQEDFKAVYKIKIPGMTLLDAMTK